MTGFAAVATELKAPPSTRGRGQRRPDAYREVLEAFGEVAAAMGELQKLDDLLHLIARHICELAGVRRCSLYLREQQTGLYRGQVGHWESDIDARVKCLVTGIESDGFTREILQTRAPVVVSDAASDPRPIKSTMREWRVRSMLGVPMVLRDEVIGIVYLDDEDRLRTYSREDAAIVLAFADLAAVAISQAQLANDLRERIAVVAAQNKALRQADAVEERLSALVLDGGSVNDVVEALAELTGKTVTLHDRHMRQVAAAQVTVGGPVRVPRLLESSVREHPAVAAKLGILQPMRPTVIGPVLSAGLPHRFLVVAVHVLGERWGTVVIREEGSRLVKTDADVARRAATILALAITAERRAFSSRWEARAALAAALVAKDCDVSEIENRAERLGIRLRVPQVVVTVTRRAGSVEALPSAQSFVGRLSLHCDEHTQILAASVPDGLVVLVELAGANGFDGVDAVVQSFSKVIRDDFNGNLAAGISNPRDDPSKYQEAFEESRQVVASLSRFGGGRGAVVTAAELGPLRVFLCTADGSEVSRFVSEALGPLMEAQHASLLATLQCFLQVGQNMRKAAERLRVHENTIRYRMSRIEQLMGVPMIADTNAQVSAHLAFVVLRLQGRDDADPSGHPLESVSAAMIASCEADGQRSR